MGVTAQHRGWLSKGLLAAFFAVGSLILPYGAHAYTNSAGQTCFLDAAEIEHCETTNADGETVTQTQGADADDPVTQQSTGADNSSSSLWDMLTNGGLGFVLSPVAILAWAVFKIGSFILGIAGIVFNWVTVVVVFKFAEYLGNSEGMLLAWGILRDFGNIALIFGFVYIGIRTILDIGHFNTGKSLAALVVAAVLMNFSLFAAEAVIDTANLLSSTLYEQSYDESQCSNATWLDCAINTGVAGQILNKLTISSAFASGDADGNILSAGLSYFSEPIPVILKFIGLALLVTIAALVLFAGAFMLISRGVILAFLMVTSPIGLAGMAVPPLEKLSQDWWHKLFHQAMFAPVFILLLLVSLRMTDGLNNLARGQGGLAAAISSGNAVANTGPLILFALIMGFMIASLMIANRFGIYFSDLATSTASRLSFGAIGALGRRTVGRWAYRQREGIKKSGAYRTGWGRLRAGLYDMGAKGNYNIASTKPAQSIAHLAKVDIGHGQHGGVDHIMHEQGEKLEKYGRAAENTAEEKALLGGAKAAAEAETKTNKKLKEEQTRHAEGNEAAESGFRMQDANIKALTEQIAKAQAERAEKIAAAKEKVVTVADSAEVSRMESEHDAQVAREEQSLELQRQQLEAARQARDTHVAQGQELAKQVRESERRMLDARKRETDLKAALNPQKLVAEGLKREIRDGSFLNRTQVAHLAPEIYEHAIHALEKYGKMSDSDRALEKLTKAVQATGESTTKAIKGVTHELDEQNRALGGDKRDDHAEDHAH